MAATIDGGLLSSQLSLRSQNHQNVSISAFPKRNLVISPLKISMSAFPKHKVFSLSKFSISTFPKHNHVIYPSKSRGSYFKPCCSSKIDRSIWLSPRHSVFDKLKRYAPLFSWKLKELMGIIKPPIPQYYRIITLEMIFQAGDDLAYISSLLQNMYDSLHEFEENQTFEKMFGDIIHRFTLDIIIEVVNDLYCIWARSIACSSHTKLLEKLPVFLEQPYELSAEENTKDSIDGLELMLQLSVDGEIPDEGICTSGNLEEFLEQLMFLEGKIYAIRMSKRAVKLDKKIVEEVPKYSHITKWDYV